MRLLISLALSAAFLCGATLSAHADDKALEGKIKARQGFYQLVSNNAGTLFGMAKGDIDYDTKTATTAANNLKTLMMLDTGSLWAPGSSKEEMPGKTRALKKIWDTYPAIAEKGAALNKAIETMAASAGTGLDGIRANIGALGAACKACHDEYRADTF